MQKARNVKVWTLFTKGSAYTYFRCWISLLRLRDNSQYRGPFTFTFTANKGVKRPFNDVLNAILVLFARKERFNSGLPLWEGEAQEGGWEPSVPLSSHYTTWFPNNDSSSKHYHIMWVMSCKKPCSDLLKQLRYIKICNQFWQLLCDLWIVTAKWLKLRCCAIINILKIIVTWPVNLSYVLSFIN